MCQIFCGQSASAWLETKRSGFNEDVHPFTNEARVSDWDSYGTLGRFFSCHNLNCKFGPRLGFNEDVHSFINEARVSDRGSYGTIFEFT